jgi:DNA-directed RNA polymerase specialized sigma24 family protein
MAEVLEAHRAYKQADEDALAMRARARARLGLAVVQAHAQDISLEEIARSLGVSSEQVRRYRQAYRDWIRDHPGESPA